MKKRFIAVYALIGVLALGSTTLTSCVDDNESASVTAVRDAKAAQLNALAALNNAKAEAERITSEANAAYRAAETRFKEIQNEMEELKLQAMKDTLETSLKTAQLIAESNLMAAQQQMEQAKAQLIQALDVVDEANKSRINVLIANANAILNGGTTQKYDVTQNKYVTDQTIEGSTYDASKTNSIVLLRKTLLTKEAKLIGYNYDLKDIEVTLAEKMEEYESKIATQEALKARYEELKANSSREAIEQEYTDAKAEKEAAGQAKKATSEALALEGKELKQYWTDVVANNEVNNAQGLADYKTEYEGYLTVPADLTNLINTTGTTGKEINVAAFLDDKDEKDNYKTVIEFSDGAVQSYDKSYNTTLESVIGSGTFKKEQEFNAENAQLLTDLQTYITRDIAVYSREVVEAARTALNTAVTSNQATLTTLNQAVATAQAAYNAAPTTANATALADAEQNVKNFEDNYPQTGKTITVLRGELETNEETLAAKQEAQAVVTKIQTLLTGDAMTEYANLYTELYKMTDEYFAAEIENTKTTHDYGVAESLVNLLVAYVDGASLTSPADDLIPDWDDLIAECDKSIRDNEEKIEKINYDKYVDTDGDRTNDAGLNDLKQDLIDATQAEIDRIKMQIEQQEAQYDSYMQQAQELIENGSTIPDVEVPETPSTDTETPAEDEEAPAA